MTSRSSALRESRIPRRGTPLKEGSGAFDGKYGDAVGCSWKELRRQRYNLAKEKRTSQDDDDDDMARIEISNGAEKICPYLKKKRNTTKLRR